MDDTSYNPYEIKIPVTGQRQGSNGIPETGYLTVFVRASSFKDALGLLAQRLEEVIKTDSDEFGVWAQVK